MEKNNTHLSKKKKKKKNQQVNLKFLNNPTTYTYTHTPVKLISPSPPWTTFPFSALRGPKPNTNGSI